MRCAQCGFENEGDARFCGNCGTTISITTAIPPAPAVPPGLNLIYCPRCRAGNEANSRYCSSCGMSFTVTTENQPRSGMNTSMTVKQTSAGWWLLPLFMTWVGGLIAYLVVRDSDQSKAKRLLWFGLGMTAFWLILYILLALVLNFLEF